MENKELTMEIDHINMNTQEVISIDWRSKGIRLDVFARNSAQVFDIDGDRTIKSFFISANCDKLLNEEISDISGLPLEQVQKLQAELSVAV